MLLVTKFTRNKYCCESDISFVCVASPSYDNSTKKNVQFIMPYSNGNNKFLMNDMFVCKVIKFSGLIIIIKHINEKKK